MKLNIEKENPLTRLLFGFAGALCCLLLIPLLAVMLVFCAGAFPLITVLRPEFLSDVEQPRQDSEG